MSKKIEWPPETSQIVENLKAKIRELIETDAEAKAHFDLFIERLHQTPDGSIKVTREEAIEFFAIYFVTKPVQDIMFPERALFDRIASMKTR